MEWYIVLALIGVGLYAGFINTLAGSGSLITLPFLMSLGLDPHTANGTNRIAILLQNVVGVATFKQQKVFQWKEGLWLGLPAVIGSFIGSRIAVDVNKEVLNLFIGGLLFVMFFIVLYKPDRWIKSKAGQVADRPGVTKMLVFFFIGAYGGFIQAGVGFFLLGGLVLGASMDLVKANAIKVFIVLMYTPIALATFMYYEQVDYKYGLILAAGNMVGAFFGSKVTVSWGPKFVRYVLLITLLVAAVYTAYRSTIFQ